MNNNFIDPMAAGPAAPTTLTQEELQRQALLKAMQGLNARQAPVATSGAATANALAQGLNGYLQGMALKRQPQQLGPNPLTVESSVVPLPLGGQ